MNGPISGEPLVRPAKAADLDRLLEIHLAAYPDERGLEARTRNFKANALGGFDRLLVAEAPGGRVVGHAFVFALEAFFGGRKVKTAGVASLAVAPEARGRGVATALMRHADAVATERGAAIAILYAFRQGFYARLGYGASASRRRLAIDPRSIPRAWRAPTRAPSTPEDAAAIKRAYLKAAARASGWLVRPDALWERLLARDRRHHLVLADRGASGYVAFELRHREPHAATSLVVEELAAATDEARRGLLGALGAMRDQVSEIVLEVDAGDALETALVDPDGHRDGTADLEHGLGAIVGGPMVRLIDVARAIESRGYAGDGAFVVDVDAGAGAGAGAGARYAVRVVNGRARVTASARGRRPPDLRVGRAPLATILYGGVRVTEAARLGLALAGEARTRPTADKLDAILALPPPAPVDPF